MFGRSCGQTSFCKFWVFSLEFLEICKFVWPRGIYPEAFSVEAFDWGRQLANRICNEGAGLDHRVGTCRRESEIPTNKSTFCLSSELITNFDLSSFLSIWAFSKPLDPTDLRLFHMTRRAVSRRVIPVPGCLAAVVAKIVLVRKGCSTSNFLKSVNSFGLAVFFRSVSWSMLSIGGAKSPNEFATKALDWNTGSVHVAEHPKFRPKN